MYLASPLQLPFYELHDLAFFYPLFQLGQRLLAAGILQQLKRGVDNVRPFNVMVLLVGEAVQMRKVKLHKMPWSWMGELKDTYGAQYHYNYAGLHPPWSEQTHLLATIHLLYV